MIKPLLEFHFSKLIIDRFIFFHPSKLKIDSFIFLSFLNPSPQFSSLNNYLLFKFLIKYNTQQ